MQAPVIVRAGGPAIEKVADILADSFSKDPGMNWVIPDVGLYAGFYKLLALGLCMPHYYWHALGVLARP